MILTYTSSRGAVFDLYSVRIKEANFHAYGWTRETISRRYGERLVRFTKAPQEYSVTFAIFGSNSEKRQKVERLHAEMEYDIIHQTPGRIRWNLDYIEGYFVTSSTSPEEGNVWATNEVTFYCPSPFWIEEKAFSIFPDQGGEVEEDAKGYQAGGYSYSYSYTRNTGRETLSIDHYSASPFRLIAYGPAQNPSITIGGNLYKVDVDVPSGGYLVIDSRDTTPADQRIVLVSADGTWTNVFDDRDPESDIFAPIPSGEVSVDYVRTYGIDLTVFLERSEPR